MRNYKQEKQLNAWFLQMMNQYSGLSFKYEYNENRGVFFVSAIIDTRSCNYEDYCAASMDFEDYMNAEYGDEAPLFTDNEELFSLSEDAIIINNISYVDAISKSFSVSDNDILVAFATTKSVEIKPCGCDRRRRKNTMKQTIIPLSSAA